ncbi:hypothetical protein M441DRAFT_48792 [Trichoderma asperellum CBS 433.97]|uniref:Uncharacterized protein n=1 Tax=Trichoderma asperellum (strain ATCC 204424 / CBS 433.97 / NBRC 101777) TaxID=1042311 RepID=A0A2T3Z4D3_TRIA4|nr:hypothetical protein M441DRAFT_48792 [Trichoderma asperellum CBS 433.97]PTB39654.1 hypothetical protein M441DRAFT_48792 [Trichoderma asperellum CBS 433.97]
MVAAITPRQQLLCAESRPSATVLLMNCQQVVAVLHIGSEQLRLQLVPLPGARNTDLIAARLGTCLRAPAHSIEWTSWRKKGYARKRCSGPKQARGHGNRVSGDRAWLSTLGYYTDARVLMRLDAGKTTANKSLMLDRMTSQELSSELEIGQSGVLPPVVRMPAHNKATASIANVKPGLASNPTYTTASSSNRLWYSMPRSYEYDGAKSLRKKPHYTSVP